MARQSFPVVLSAPSGTGKTTLAHLLVDSMSNLEISVSYTTRARRGNEQEGLDYHFVDDAEFDAKIGRGAFLEWAKVHGDYYGTHQTQTEAVLAQGPVLFNIDVQGAEQLTTKFPDRCVTIFLLPESYEQMVEHIKNRGEMSEGDFKARLKSAEFELAKKDHFTHQVVNAEGKLSQTIETIAKIIEPYLTATGAGIDKKF